MEKGHCLEFRSPEQVKQGLVRGGWGMGDEGWGMGDGGRGMRDEGWGMRDGGRRKALETGMRMRVVKGQRPILARCLPAFSLVMRICMRLASARCHASDTTCPCMSVTMTPCIDRLSMTAHLCFVPRLRHRPPFPPQHACREGMGSELPCRRHCHLTRPPYSCQVLLSLL